MKIWIPSKGRAKTITTHLYVGDEDYTIVVHNKEEYAAYAANPTINPHRLVISNQPYGLCQQRQWILDQHQIGEWVLMLDDNIKSIVKLKEPWYSDKTKQKVSDDDITDITIHEFFALLDNDIAYAEQRNIHLIGFNPSSNYYWWDNRKYATIGYVIGKMIVVKKSKLTYDMALLSIDDHDFTAQNLFAFGAVLVNRFVHPIAKHYEAGGLGTYEERLQKRLQDCAYLIAKWHGLFRFKERYGYHPQQDVALRFYDHGRLEKWRKTIIQGVL